jgi:TolB protein
MTIRWRGILASTLGALTASWLVVVPAAAQETAPDGTLVFASSGLWDINPAGDYDVFRMNADGTELVNLTETEADQHDGPQDTQPRWSPDGSRIVWTSTRDGGWDTEIWAMDADGTNQVALTQNEAPDYAPAFSPDGTKVAWSVDDQEFFDFDIWLMDADGSNQHNVLNESPEELQWHEWQPDWTAGGRLVFSGTEFIEAGGDGELDGAYYKIAAMDADGTNRETLSDLLDPVDGVPNHDEQPAVSPDGAWIAFGQNKQPEQDWDIVVIRTSDGAQFNLTNSYPQVELFPMWSPDGTKLVFTANAGEDGQMDLFYIDVADFSTGGTTTARVAATAPLHRLTEVGGIQSADWYGGDTPPPPPGPACTKTGTSGPDRIRGTAGADVLCGLGGADTIYGFGGNDVILGGPGADVVYGGGGADELRGARGADDLYGEVGADELFGGLGNDDLRGGAGADTCVQGPGSGLRLSCLP